MYDSSVKLPIGIEHGETYQLGNFDACMQIDELPDKEMRIKAKYCLLNVTIPGYTVRELGTRRKIPQNLTEIHWGLCMPASCSTNDIVSFFKLATGIEKASLEIDKCHENKPETYSTISIFYG